MSFSADISICHFSLCYAADDLEIGSVRDEGVLAYGRKPMHVTGRPSQLPTPVMYEFIQNLSPLHHRDYHHHSKT